MVSPDLMGVLAIYWSCWTSASTAHYYHGTHVHLCSWPSCLDL